MAAPPTLTATELKAAIDALPGWTLAAGKLHTELKFRSFVQAFGFMTQVALVAESMNHHPEWFNVYSRVRIDLTTHESGGITGLDLTLARHISTVASALGAAHG